MDFSHDWKSPWPVAGVHRAPRLLNGAAADALGPLSFLPSAAAAATLLSSFDLAPDLPHPSTHRLALRSFCNQSLIPLSLAPPPRRPPESPALGCLCALRRGDGGFAVFFPFGENSDGIGYVLMTFVDGKLELCPSECKDGFFKMPGRFYHKILKLSVSATDSCSFAVNGMDVEGILMACTLYCVRWFGICSEVAVNDDSSTKRLVLVSLGVVDLKSCVVSACLSQHMREESAVILESGEVHLFDLNACFEALRLPKKLHGSCLKMNDELGKLGLNEAEGKWLGCEFGWHPRILILARTNAIFMVDFRGVEKKVNVLAEIGVLAKIGFHSVKGDHFTAFCLAHFDAFYFAAATKRRLLLFDSRHPSLPILQWDHWLDRPNNINMFRMSELRPLSGGDEYNWSRQSGYAILLGSMHNCEYNVFCYGPLPPSVSSLATAFSKFSCPFYAWGLPSRLSFSGKNCLCGDCLVRGDFIPDTLPSGVEKCSQRRKNTILGFCIIVDLPGKVCDATDFGGFTLIKLKLSGKLKSRKYHACDPLSYSKSDCHEADSSYLLDSYLPSLARTSEILVRSRYRNIDYILGYMNGYLARSTFAKMRRRISLIRIWSQTLTKNLTNSIAVPISNAVRSDIGTLDMIKIISFSTSMPEIALSKMWVGLPSEFLEIAFPKLQNVMVRGSTKEKFLKFLDVSHLCLAQMPPFILRKCLNAKEKVYSQLYHSNDNFVGPVLPLPALHAWDCLDGVAGKMQLQPEMELDSVCDNIFKDVEDLMMEKFGDIVSLSQEEDKSQEDKPFFTYKVGKFFLREIVNEEGIELEQVKESCSKVGKPEIIVCRKRKASVFSPEDDANGMEMFNGLCTAQLNFNCEATTSFPSKELKFYKCLKREFLKWQGSYQPHLNFWSSIE